MKLDQLVEGFIYSNWEDKENDGRLVRLVDKLPGTIYGEPGYVIEMADGSRRHASGRQLHPWFHPKAAKELDQLLYEL